MKQPTIYNAPRRVLEKIFNGKKVKLHPPLVNDGTVDHLKILDKPEMRKKLKQ